MGKKNKPMFDHIQELDPIPKGYWVIGYLWRKQGKEVETLHRPVVITNEVDCFIHLVAWLKSEGLTDFFKLKRDYYIIMHDPFLQIKDPPKKRKR